MTTPQPGSRWVARRGVHAGNEVEVERLTDGDRVIVHPVGGEGGSWSKSKSDAAGRWTLGRDVFVKNYVPREALASGNGKHTGRAFRRVYQPRLEEEPEMAEAKAPQAPSKNGITRPDEFQSGYGLGLTFGIELITPEMANTWLDRGGANRKKSERNVIKLVAAIQMGEWKVTGESIQLDSEGRVRNGQHRLEAIYRSGIACYALVVRGVQEDAFDVIDTGRSRNAANVLEIHGHTQTIAKATAARGLIHIERFGRYAPGTARTTVPGPSNAAILAYVESHPEIEQGVHMGDRLRVGAKFAGGSGLWAIAFALFIRINPEQAEVFCQSLIEGANLEAGSPVLKLRNAYIGGGKDWQATAENRERLLAVTIKAWNFWRRDELVSVLTWHSTGRTAEKFPTAE